MSWLSESHYTVYEGNNRVEIECSATGIPEPDVNIMPFSGQQFDGGGPSLPYTNSISQAHPNFIIDTVEVISDSKIAIPDAIPGTTATRFLCKAIQAMDTASFVTLKTVHLDIRCESGRKPCASQSGNYLLLFFSRWAAFYCFRQHKIYRLRDHWEKRHFGLRSCIG